jgi:hypothetical protein
MYQPASIVLEAVAGLVYIRCARNELLLWQKRMVVDVEGMELFRKLDYELSVPTFDRRSQSRPHEQHILQIIQREQSLHRHLVYIYSRAGH